MVISVKLWSCRLSS